MAWIDRGRARILLIYGLQINGELPEPRIVAGVTTVDLLGSDLEPVPFHHPHEGQRDRLTPRESMSFFHLARIDGFHLARAAGRDHAVATGLLRGVQPPVRQRENTVGGIAQHRYGGDQANR